MGHSYKVYSYKRKYVYYNLSHSRTSPDLMWMIYENVTFVLLDSKKDLLNPEDRKQVPTRFMFCVFYTNLLLVFLWKGFILGLYFD